MVYDAMPLASVRVICLLLLEVSELALIRLGSGLQPLLAQPKTAKSVSVYQDSLS